MQEQKGTKLTKKKMAIFCNLLCDPAPSWPNQNRVFGEHEVLYSTFLFFRVQGGFFGLATTKTPSFITSLNSALLFLFFLRICVALCDYLSEKRFIWLPGSKRPFLGVEFPGLRCLQEVQI